MNKMYYDGFFQKLFIAFSFVLPTLSSTNVNAQQVEQRALLDSIHHHVEVQNLHALQLARQASMSIRQSPAKADTPQYTEMLDRIESERSRKVYTYGNNGSFTMVESIKKDGKWLNQTSEETVYCTDGSVEISSYMWANDSWSTLSSQKYTFYPNGQMKTMELFNYTEGKLSYESHSTYWEDGSTKTGVYTSYKDGVVDYKGMYEYFDNGKYKSKNYESYKNGELDYETRSEYYENGQLRTSYDRYYDGYEHWYNGSYNSDGVLVEYSRAGSGYSEPVFYTKTTQKYNDRGEPIWSQWWNKVNNEWVLRGKTEYTYDTKNRLKEEYTYVYNDGAWELTESVYYLLPDGSTSTTRTGDTYRYSYSSKETDKHERQEECKAEYLSGDRWIVNDYQSYVKTFDSKGLLVVEEKNKRKYTYEYNAADQVLNMYTYKQSSGSWVAEEKELYTYDAMGNVVCDETYKWDNSEGEWFLNGAIYATYDDKNNNTMSARIDSDGYGYKNEYLYDDEGELIGILRFNYVDGEWITENGSKTETQYDANGNRIGYIYYDYLDGQWIAYGGYKREEIYNATTDMIISMTEYSYANDDWVVTYYNHYDDYGDCIENFSDYNKFKRVYTYDLGTSSLNIYNGRFGPQKRLTEVYTHLDTNEVENFVYHYVPFNIAGIESVECNTQTPSTYYNLSGRRVTSDKTHGVFVVNGKKVVK